jgi:hypothetical protein
MWRGAIVGTTALLLAFSGCATGRSVRYEHPTKKDLMARRPDFVTCEGRTGVDRGPRFETCMEALGYTVRPWDD